MACARIFRRIARCSMLLLAGIDLGSSPGRAFQQHLRHRCASFFPARPGRKLEDLTSIERICESNGCAERCWWLCLWRFRLNCQQRAGGYERLVRFLLTYVRVDAASTCDGQEETQRQAYPLARCTRFSRRGTRLHVGAGNTANCRRPRRRSRSHVFRNAARIDVRPGHVKQLL